MIFCTISFCLYSQALAENDLRGNHAFEEAGPVFNEQTERMEPFVSPEKIRAARIERGRKLKPRVANWHDRATRLACIYEHAVATVRRAVLEQASTLDERQPEICFCRPCQRMGE